MSGNTPWDIGAISNPLRDYFLTLKDKKIEILIPGAGNAYEAEFLFDLGFKHVNVLDFSEKAIKNFLIRCPDFPKENLLTEDFFSHEGKYDLIIEQTFFCALNPEMRPDYVRKMHELLKQGGKLCGLLFDDPNLKGNPPFGGTRQEYEILFEKYFEFTRLETPKNSIAPRSNREIFVEMLRKTK